MGNRRHPEVKALVEDAASRPPGLIRAPLSELVTVTQDTLHRSFLLSKRIFGILVSSFL